jgi:Polysaccharide deacetylase
MEGINLTLQPKRRVLALGYHDVFYGETHDISGFRGLWSARYKLDRDSFARHLQHISAAMLGATIGVVGACETGSVFLTFDDGGASSYDPIAPMLEKYGFRGHFFVTTSMIGSEGFLTADQIKDLDRRGHVIGSHSCSHPDRMSHIPYEDIVKEWQVSVSKLADIVGHTVNIASLPGGYYSKTVAVAAANSGITTLFTSEPTTYCSNVNGCRVFGRYVFQQGLAPRWAGQVAAGERLPRLKQAVEWKLKRGAATLFGRLYLRTAARLRGGDLAGSQRRIQ